MTIEILEKTMTSRKNGDPGWIDKANKINGVDEKPKRKRAIDSNGLGQSLSTLKPDECYIYFVSTDDVPGYPIKVGLSNTSLQTRIRSLQTACPYKLKLLAVVKATKHYEFAVHVALAEHRLQGEWFRRHPDVMAEIRRARREHQRLNRELIPFTDDDFFAKLGVPNPAKVA